MWERFLANVESLLRQLESSWQRLFPENATPMQTALFTAGAFLAVTLVVFLVGRLLFGFRRNRLAGSQLVGSKRPLMFGILTETLAWVIPTSSAQAERLRGELVKAGFYHRKALEEYLAFRNAAVIFWLLFVAFAVVALADPNEDLTPKLLIGGLAVLLVIYSLPRLILGQQAKRRSERIQYALPDALDMINMTVTGGLPLRQAIKRVGDQLHTSHPDIACELAIIDHQTDAGSLDHALRKFAQRLDVPDITALAMMVRHAEQLGGSVTVAFREFADSIRRTRRQRAEEQGNKASIKLLFPIVFCLAPPIYILLLGPAAVELKNFIRKEVQPGGALSQSTTNLQLETVPDNRTSNSVNLSQ